MLTIFCDVVAVRVPASSGMIHHIHNIIIIDDVSNSKLIFTVGLRGRTYTSAGGGDLFPLLCLTCVIICGRKHTVNSRWYVYHLV